MIKKHQMTLLISPAIKKCIKRQAKKEDSTMAVVCRNIFKNAKSLFQDEMLEIRKKPDILVALGIRLPEQQIRLIKALGKKYKKVPKSKQSSLSQAMVDLILYYYYRRELK